MIIFLDDNLGSAKRAFCQCDLAFVNAVDGKSTPNKNYDTTKCVPNNSGGDGKCCKSPTGLYILFNSQKYQCCSGSVVSLGSC